MELLEHNPQIVKRRFLALKSSSLQRFFALFYILISWNTIKLD